MTAVTGSVPFPFITKDSSLSAFKTVSTDEYNAFLYGTVLTGNNYPQTASIKSDIFASGHDNIRIRSLKNTLNYNSFFSQHYQFSSSYGDKSQQELRLISIPSLFYGSSIRKGTVDLSWYFTGSLMAQLKDETHNGELIQVGPSGSLGSGSVAGVVLYKEGFVLLTGSWSLHSTYTDNFNINNITQSLSPSWKYFFLTGSGTTNYNAVPSSSFKLDFEGEDYISKLTMLTHLDKGEFNHSNNPTYVKYDSVHKLPITSSTSFIESEDSEIKNIVYAEYSDVEPKFEKITYVSKIGIYDKNKNLIAIAKLAKPVRKKLTDQYSLKLSIDLG